LTKPGSKAPFNLYINSSRVHPADLLPHHTFTCLKEIQGKTKTFGKLIGFHKPIIALNPVTVPSSFGPH
jgi:hypothetical protein